MGKAMQAKGRTWLLPRVKGGATEVPGKEQVRSGSGLPRIPVASLLRLDQATDQKQKTQAEE